MREEIERLERLIAFYRLSGFKAADFIVHGLMEWGPDDAATDIVWTIERHDQRPWRFHPGVQFAANRRHVADRLLHRLPGAGDTAAELMPDRPCGTLPAHSSFWEETMTKLQMRRRALLAAAPVLVAAPYVAQAQTGKPEKAKVVLAVGGKSALYYLSVTIAETKGFYKDAGLDVEINDFQGGAKSLEALMGGSADVVAGAYEHTIRMQQRGQPIKGSP